MRALLVAILLTMPPALALARADTDEARHVGTLALGGRLFWNGPNIEDAGFDNNAIQRPICSAAGLPCILTAHLPTGPVPCAVGQCVEYTVEVAEPGGTLRIAMDWPSYEDEFEGHLFGPDGAPLGGFIPIGCCFYSAEVRVADAAPGAYTFQVVFSDVHDTGFRLRATLESPTTTPAPPRLLYPNLRMAPPFELEMGTCQPTEILAGAVSCMRFAVGPENIGKGVLDIRVREIDAEGAREVQRIHRSDGTWIEVPAGFAEFHAEHGHFHHHATGGIALWRVVDAETGALEPAGESSKIGFCMTDGAIVKWRSFDQGPQGSGSSPSGCYPVPEVPTFGLTAGWADVYPGTAEGNYVDVAGLPDGLYVLRARTDADGSITESDETDNDAYTLLHLAGGTVDVLERGYGTDPWDPAKELSEDGRLPLRPAQ